MKKISKDNTSNFRKETMNKALKDYKAPCEFCGEQYSNSSFIDRVKNIFCRCLCVLTNLTNPINSKNKTQALNYKPSTEISAFNNAATREISAFNNAASTEISATNNKEDSVPQKIDQTQDLTENKDSWDDVQKYKIKSITHQLFIENVKELPKNLSDSELNLLRTLLNKKLGKNNQSFIENQIRLIEKGDIESLNHLIKGKFNSNKRKDEAKKFIYRNVVKSMKNEFMRVRKLSKSKETETMFWGYYFHAYAFKHNIPITYFSDPLNDTYKKNEGFKYIRTDYFDYLFNNSFFYSEFEKHLNKLKENYMSILAHKIGVLFKSISKEKTKGIRNGRIGLKLPWSVTEIELAVEEFKKQMKESRGICCKRLRSE